MATSHMNMKSELKEWIPRIGYAVRGVVYFIIGILAIMVAVGEGGQLSGSKGALQSVQQAPFADVLLGFMGVGLLCFALWRFVECFIDPEHKGSDGKGLVKRAGYFVSGIIHTVLGVYSFQLIGAGSGGGGGQGWSDKLMSTGAGPWVIGIVGLIVAGFAVYQLYKGYKKRFLDSMRTEEMNFKTRRAVTRLGQVGIISRGVVFGVVAWFLIKAAAGAGSAESAGLGSALAEIASQSYGTILLFIVAAGLAAFGIYSAAMGYYRRIAW